MNIGILTFQFGYNYGGILQCLALQQVMREMGHYAEVIDYYPYIETRFNYLRGWGILSGNLLEQAIVRYLTIRMKHKCEYFKRMNINFSPKCNNLYELAELTTRFDAILVGSDQVWNRVYHDSPAYYLGWEPSYQGKRISYAASCGFLDQPTEGQDNIATWLGRFDELSVRDQVTFDMIYNLCGRSAKIVADPTLLYDFATIPLSPNTEHNKYIFMYTLGEEIVGGHKCVINNIRQRFGDIPVLQVVPTAHKCSIYSGSNTMILDAGPEEWLNLLANAAFVYTDSFHAALFSIKYRKPFLAYYSESIRSARLTDLAERYKVHNAVICSIEDAERRRCFDIKLNYDEIHNIIKIHIDESLAYLKNAVSGY